MKTTHVLLLLIFPCFFLSMTCAVKDTADCHARIWFHNNSDKDVYINLSFDYPDTSINFQHPKFNKNGYRIGAHSKGEINEKRNHCLEQYYIQYPFNKMSFFIFD